MRVFTVVCLLFLLTSAACGQDKTQSSTAAQGNGKKPAPAESAGPAKKAIDPEKEKDIRKLLEVTGANDTLRQMMGDMEKSIKPVLESSLPPGEYREKLVDVFFLKLRAKANLQELLEQAIPIYDQQFSREEIRGLLEFYETPLGKKTLSVLPAIMSQMMQKGQHWGEELGRETMMEVMAEHPEFQQAIEEAQKKAQP